MSKLITISHTVQHQTDHVMLHKSNWLLLAFLISVTHHYSYKPKGQLNFEMTFCCHRLYQISKENIVRISALNFFCSFLWASWKLFWASWDILSHAINKEAYRKPKKTSRNPQGCYNDGPRRC